MGAAALIQDVTARWQQQPFLEDLGGVRRRRAIRPDRPVVGQGLAQQRQAHFTKGTAHLAFVHIAWGVGVGDEFHLGLIQPQACNR